MNDGQVLSFWNEWLDAFRKAAEIPDDRDEEREDYEANEYYRSRVNGGISDPEYVPLDECISEIEDIIDGINKLVAEDDPGVVFDMASFKRNGTFNRSTKPVLRRVSFGPYWDDAYGWQVECIRMEPVDDTHARIVNTNYVEHY